MSITLASYGTNLLSSWVLSGVTRQAGPVLPWHTEGNQTSVGWVSQAQEPTKLFWKHIPRGGTRGASGEPVMFYFLIWMLVKWVCSLIDSSLRYLIICALFHTCTSIKWFLKQSYVLIFTPDFKLLYYNQCVQTSFIYREKSGNFWQWTNRPLIQWHLFLGLLLRIPGHSPSCYLPLLSFCAYSFDYLINASLSYEDITPLGLSLIHHILCWILQHSTWNIAGAQQVFVEWISESIHVTNM